MPGIRSFRAIVQEATSNRRPAILRDYARTWKAVQRWKDITYLRHVLDNKQIRIEVGLDYVSAQVAHIPFGMFVEYLEAAGENKEEQRELAYWAQDSFPHELFDDVVAPIEDISTEAYDARIWCGPNSTLSPLHFDPTHNLFVQVVGSKEVALVMSDDTKIPRVSRQGTNQSHNTSSIDAFDPRHSEMFEIHTLRPGDAMVVPKKMWHSVRAIEDAKGPPSAFTMSVSFWWTADSGTL